MRYSDQVKEMINLWGTGRFPSAVGEGEGLVAALTAQVPEELLAKALAYASHGANPVSCLSAYSDGVHEALWCVQQFGIPDDIAELTGLPGVPDGVVP